MKGISKVDGKYNYLGECIMQEDAEGHPFWGRPRKVIGLFSPVKDDVHYVELRGVKPEGNLRKYARVPAPGKIAGNADLFLLDTKGEKIGNYFLGGFEVLDSRASVEYSGSFDLTVKFECDALYAEASQTWELLRTRELNRYGIWHSRGPRGRKAWLSVALNHHNFRSQNVRPPRLTYEIDGSSMDDMYGFYCEIGERLNGPGGYFGWNIPALDDCLVGDWGVGVPFSLIWNNSEFARSALNRNEEIREVYGKGFFDVVIDVLLDRGIDITLR